MKRIIAVLLLACSTAMAQEILEKPVSNTGTGATVDVTFMLGSVGWVQDIFLYCQASTIQTGTVSIINTANSFTNSLIGTFVFTNMSMNRLSQAYPVQFGDIIRTTFTSHANGVTNKPYVWFKNVVH